MTDTRTTLPTERNLVRALLFALALTGLGCGPVWWFPGGELRGTSVSSPVADWATLDHCKIIQLETRSPEPYSINIWAAGLGDQLYLASGGGTDSRWVRNIEAEPSVRVGACGSVYALRATHTTEEADLERFLSAVERKYDWKREQALEYRSWVFRLEPYLRSCADRVEPWRVGRASRSDGEPGEHTLKPGLRRPDPLGMICAAPPAPSGTDRWI